MRKLLLLLLTMVCAFNIMAQEKSVSGKVTDEKDNTPLAGVSIIVRGTTIGTTTAQDGTFRLNIPSSAKSLIISLLDYESQEVAIGTKNSFSIALLVRFQKSVRHNLNQGLPLTFLKPLLAQHPEFLQHQETDSQVVQQHCE